MASTEKPIGDMMLKQAFGEEEFEARNPTVLSCGGIYIPRKPEEQRILYHVITTSNKNEPVKVMTGIRPRNILREVLIKESMN